MSKKKPRETVEGLPECQAAMLQLSPTDQRHVEQLERSFQIVRDYTASVASGRTTGFYLHGSGGCGKSYTIIGELERLKVPYKLYNSRMTGRGLFNALAAFPDAIHLLEDMEQLFRESGARGVLRHAPLVTASQGGRTPCERLVTWTTYKMEHQFIFTGGIIMTANRPFSDVPELEAVKTRIAYMHLVTSDNQLMALMRRVSAGGYREGLDILDPHRCMLVWSSSSSSVGGCTGLSTCGC